MGNIEKIWVDTKDTAREIFEDGNCPWKGEHTIFQIMDITVVSGRKSKNMQLVISFSVEQDFEHYYYACHKDGVLVDLTRCHY